MGLVQERKQMAKALSLPQTRTPSLRRYAPALLVGLALLLVLYNALVQPIGPFPEAWNLHLADPLDAFKK
jgi:formate hydrogenlyase subunit 4